MYAATPTWTPVDTTSSVAQSAAATSAMIVDAWDGLMGPFLWLVPRSRDECLVRSKGLST
jgi:hypothetical protein